MNINYNILCPQCFNGCNRSLVISNGGTTQINNYWTANHDISIKLSLTLVDKIVLIKPNLGCFYQASDNFNLICQFVITRRMRQIGRNEPFLDF